MKRGHLLTFFIIAVAVVYIGKLFFLQVASQSNQTPLQSSTVKKIFDYPERGYIYDRNNTLLVTNKHILQLDGDSKRGTTLGHPGVLQATAYRQRLFYQADITRAKKWSRRLPSVFLAHLSKEDYAYLQEKMHRVQRLLYRQKNY